MIATGSNLQRENALERVPIAWNHAIEKDSLKIKEMEHVLIGKPLRTFLRTCSSRGGDLRTSATAALTRAARKHAVA